jgi:hypothetical protein
MRRVWSAALLWLVTIGLCLATTRVAAEDAPALRNAWYHIEVVIFDRLEDASAGELMIGKPATPFPLSARAFVAADPSQVYPLDPATLSEPALPSLTFTPSQPSSTASVPAADTGAATAAPGPAAPPPTPAQQAQALLDEYEQSLFAQCFEWLPPKTFVLSAPAARLDRSGRYRVLLHGAWIAPLPDRDAPLPMLIQTGAKSGDRWRIEGTIAVTVARYLHADVELRYLVDATAPNDPTAPPTYLEMREDRRLRSGELHYLDHPRFGVLLQIDPVTVPDGLAARIDALLAPPPELPQPAPDQQPTPAKR